MASEWLRIMLDEIARKEEEARQAREEEARRREEQASRRDSDDRCDPRRSSGE